MDYESGQIKKTDLIVILAHSTIGPVIWYTYQQEPYGHGTLKGFTSGYVFALSLLLVGLFFEKLRNIKLYLVWLTIGIIQVWIYPLVRDNPDFTFPRGTSFDGLVALLPTLVMFQLLRQVFYVGSNSGVSGNYE